MEALSGMPVHAVCTTPGIATATNFTCAAVCLCTAHSMTLWQVTQYSIQSQAPLGIMHHALRMQQLSC